jgi:tetratricopeptide (TPR) repeat protein
MRTILPLVLSLVLGACAAAPVAQPTAAHLLHDELFQPPTERIEDAATIFAVSEEMRRHLDFDLAPHLRAKGRAKGLSEALYNRNMLAIDYDGTVTRNAADTFGARSGNCLSLAVMTAALARELDLEVTYNSVIGEEQWSRSGGVYFASGHVNLTLGRRYIDPKYRLGRGDLLTIDFVPTRGPHERTWVIQEATVSAMYMNNRAAEALAQGRWSDAYWWARASIMQDPGFMSAANTLGVVYRRMGHLAQAEEALRHVMAREPRNTTALSNLALVYGDQGRAADAAAAMSRLLALQPRPPFHFLERGIAAVRRGDFAAARREFAREAERDAEYHELQFWMAVADAALGDYASAGKHLRVAIKNSPDRRQSDLYSAKLALIRKK